MLSSLFRCPVSKHEGPTWPLQARQQQSRSGGGARCVKSCLSGAASPRCAGFSSQVFSKVPTFALLHENGKERRRLVPYPQSAVYPAQKLLLFMTWRGLLSKSVYIVLSKIQYTWKLSDSLLFIPMSISQRRLSTCFGSLLYSHKRNRKVYLSIKSCMIFDITCPDNTLQRL